MQLTWSKPLLQPSTLTGSLMARSVKSGKGWWASSRSVSAEAEVSQASASSRTATLQPSMHRSFSFWLPSQQLVEPVLCAQRQQVPPLHQGRNSSRCVPTWLHSWPS